jgi:hypothetical protein
MKKINRKRKKFIIKIIKYQKKKKLFIRVELNLKILKKSKYPINQNLKFKK